MVHTSYQFLSPSAQFSMSLNIYISNDDGYQAPGLKALAAHLANLGTVTVVAPAGNRSGASNSITLTSAVTLYEHDVRWYSVDGTPADCLQVAFGALASDSGGLPDIVVSGINNGPNMADDSLYSGTVGAAMEGRHLRLPPIAVSMAAFAPSHYDTAARVVADVLGKFVSPDSDTQLREFCEGHVRPVLNINVPDLGYTELSGIRVTRLGRRYAASPATLTGQHSDGRQYQLGPAGEILDRSDGTDFHAVENGYVSITPLQTDLTYHNKCTVLDTLL